MDSFNVPKKVNRHVLLAMQFLLSGKPCGTPLKDTDIISRVRYQMRRLLPVPQLSIVVMKSLKNMEKLCIVSQENENYYIYNCTPKATLSQALSRPKRKSKKDDINPVQQKKIIRKWNKGSEHKADEEKQVACGGKKKVPPPPLKTTKLVSKNTSSELHLTEASNNTSSVDLAEYLSSDWIKDSISNIQMEHSDFNTSEFYQEIMDNMENSVGVAAKRFKRNQKGKKNAAKTGRKNKKKMKSRKITHGQGMALASSGELAQIPDGIKRLASPRIIRKTPPLSFETAADSIDYKKRARYEEVKPDKVVDYEMHISDEEVLISEQSDSAGASKITSTPSSLKIQDCSTSVFQVTTSMIVHASSAMSTENRFNAELLNIVINQSHRSDRNEEENKEQGANGAFAGETSSPLVANVEETKENGLNAAFPDQG